MKIAHFSGLRLGASFPDWPDHGARIRQRQRRILSDLFQRCRAEGVSTLLCVGDLFDSGTVPLSEIRAVRQLCFEYPDVAFVVLPGRRDPWADYCPHRHLSDGASDNLTVIRPGEGNACAVQPGLWVYGIPVDAATATPPPLSAIDRGEQRGIHVALAYGSVGRLQPGPEEGLVMVSPEVTGHAFDYLALADGGPAERVGNGPRLACYARPLVPFDSDDSGDGSAWLVTFEDGQPVLEEWPVAGIRFTEFTLDVDRFADASGVATAIRRDVDEATVAHVVLTGRRPAHRPILEPALIQRCAGSLLALRVTDRTELTEPVGHDTPPIVHALWNAYRQADPESRNEWMDALRLCASGVTDPHSWKEAPWARS